VNKRELSQLYHLRREIAQISQEIEELEARAEGGSPTLSGMPHGESTDRISRYGSQSADLITLKEIKLQECWVEMVKLTRFIDAIPDSQMRQIMRLRYGNGLSWRQVANRIGGGNTEEGVRKKHDRFFEKNQSCPVVSGFMCYNDSVK